MYYLSKKMEISAAHRLRLPYGSKCAELHGHNWTITVFCKSEVLNPEGMVVDFSLVKRLVKDKLDHKNLDDVFPEMNATAENIACWICSQVPHCYKVIVQESEGNEVTYEKDS